MSLTIASKFPTKKIVAPLFFLISIMLVVACNNDDNNGAADAILKNPPYSDITDSIRLQPGNAELYFRRAVQLNKGNLPELAIADFNKAWKLSKNEKYAIAIGNLLLDRKPDSGILFLQQAIDILPESYFLRLTLARSYDAQNNVDAALKATNELLARHPEQLDALLLEAGLWQKKNDSVKALADLEKAYAIAPNSTEIVNQLAYQYAENKNSKALALADTLIAYSKQIPTGNPYYVKGVYYANLHNDAMALSFFDKAIQVEYNYLNAHIEKGKIYLAQKKNQEALKAFQLANTISPTFPDAYYWIGVTLEAMGKTADAKGFYERAYGLDKTFIEAKDAAARIK